MWKWKLEEERYTIAKIKVETKTTLTWYKSKQVLKPLPDGGVSIHVDHLILQTLSDGR